MTMAPASALTDDDFDQLASSITGTVSRPGSAGYAVGASSWNLAVASHPLAVIDVATADDVVQVVRFAGERRVEVAVRATGHGAGDSLDGALLIRTALLDELVIDPAGWARVGAGVKWGRVVEEAARFGLAPLCGSAPSVGVVGYLTGGGIGPVARTFGVSADHVRSFDVVTGDGQLRRVSAEENFDLFWALRGGKGAVGIVTAVEIDLLDVPSLYGGAVFFGAPDIADVLHAWAAWAPTLPAAATTSVAIMRLPAAPFVPPPLAGQVTLSVRFAWVGDPADGEVAFRPLLATASPVFGGVGEMPYAQIGAIHADPEDPMPASDGGGLLSTLPREAVDALLAVAGPASACVQIAVEMRLLGGAIADTPHGPTAMGHRDAAYTLLTIGIAAGPMAAVTAVDSASILASMSEWSTGGAMPNFSASTDPVEVRRSYPQETLDRLVALSASYDPRSILRAARPMREAAQATSD